MVILHRGAVLAVGTAGAVAGDGTLNGRFLAMTGADAEVVEA